MKRVSASYLRKEAATRAGCIRLSYCRLTKRLVGVYRNSESGMESDPEFPWSTVCEDHGTLVCSRTRALAIETASNPLQFCEDCREAQNEQAQAS